MIFQIYLGLYFLQMLHFVRIKFRGFCLLPSFSVLYVFIFVIVKRKFVILIMKQLKNIFTTTFFTTVARALQESQSLFQG